MRRSTMAIAAATCSGLLAIGLVAAPAASAYPPGKDQKTTTNKDEVRPGGKVKSEVRNAQPGCRATFAVVNAKGRTIETRTRTVGEDRRVQVTLPMPERSGTYTIVTTVSGRGCQAGSSEASVTVR
jgi:hypothetical protein